MDNPIIPKPIQTAFKSAKASLRKDWPTLFPIATVVSGFGAIVAGATAMNNPPLAAGGICLFVSGMAGTFVGMIAQRAFPSVSRAACLLAPVLGAVTFVPAYHNSDILYQRNQAERKLYADARKDCLQVKKGQLADLHSGPTVCLVPTKPGLFRIDPDARLNP